MCATLTSHLSTAFFKYSPYMHQPPPTLPSHIYMRTVLVIGTHPKLLLPPAVPAFPDAPAVPALPDADPPPPGGTVGCPEGTKAVPVWM